MIFVAKMQSVNIVSLGPGDPDQITLNSYRRLQSSDYIFCPKINGVSRAADILCSLSIESSKIILYDLSMDLDRSHAMSQYRDIAHEIEKLLKQDLSISVTAEGDCSIYSSTKYISDILLERGIPVESCAGIPSFLAAASLANLHIAKLNRSLIIIPGYIDYDNFKNHIINGDSVVIMKLSRLSKDVIGRISQMDKIELHYFENIGLPNQFYSNDREIICNRESLYFSLLIVISLF